MIKELEELEEKIEDIKAYAEYLAEHLDKTIKYSDYLAEELDKYITLTLEMSKIINKG